MSEEKKELRMPIKFEKGSKNEVYNDMATKKEYSPITFDQPVKDFEDKKYIILYYVVEPDTDTEINLFEICTGRTDCYIRAKEIIEENDVDIIRSIVLTETEQISRKTKRRAYFMTTVDTALNLYSFCKQMQSIYKDTEEFDIDSIVQERGYDLIGETEDDQEVDLAAPVTSTPPSGLEVEILKIYKDIAADEYSGRASFTGPGGQESSL